MNLFVIPSWYPYPATPVSGIFFKEQALAIGECRPEWNVAISLWGQGEFLLSLKRPWQNLPILTRYLTTEPASSNKLLPNVQEYRSRALEWRNTFMALHSEGPLRSSEKNLQKALRDMGTIDLMHAHVSYPAGWVAMQLSRKTGIPYVITEHMSPFPFPAYLDRDGLLHERIREPLESASSVIAVSPSLAGRMESFGISGVSYIPNLVDERFFTPSPLSANGDAFTFFTLGVLNAQKGFPDLLMAIRALLDGMKEEEQGKLRFRIGGDGPDREKLLHLAHELGISHRIEWLGLLERGDALREFQGCDCFVLTSHHETFGVVYAEAIACGKPVIATRCGGPEVIVTPENGRLVDVGDINQIADALREMSRQGRSYDRDAIRRGFLENFSREAVVSQLEKRYEQVIREKRSCAE